jgi:hypothetical protein
MSQERFDDLTRSVAGSVSRGRMLKALAGGALAAAAGAVLGARHAEADKCKKMNEHCGMTKHCCIGLVCVNHRCLLVKG